MRIRAAAPFRLACVLAATLLTSGAAPEPSDLSASSRGALRAGYGPTQDASPARLDAGRLMADVRALSAPEMEGRLAGSPGGLRAREFIIRRFSALGLDPVDGSYVQPFQIREQDGTAEPRQGANVWARVAGRVQPQEFVIVSAHYDHVGVRGGEVHPGADDNASGVAALLAAAEWFARHPPARSLLFVAFDAEELGLRGSRHFVAHPPLPLRQVKAVVNLDMLARGDDDRLVVAGTHPYPALRPAVEAAARGRRLTVTLGHDRPESEAPGIDDWTGLSDHAPFHAAGVPFLYFGVENHADYHKPTDTAERIPVRFFAEAAEVVLETLVRLTRTGA